MLARIAHTTDFSSQSETAFLHALRLALDAHSRLDLLHVRVVPSQDENWQSFPHVREAIVRWGLLNAQDTPADIDAKLGVDVSKVEINHRDAISGISTFIIGHRPDLLVVATDGRQGINRWLHGSVSEEILRRTRVPTLLIGPHSRGFVDAQSGKIRLLRILLPVAPEPEPSPAWTLKMLSSLLSPLGVSADSFELIHVAGEMPDIVDEAGKTWKIDHLKGPVVETIVRVAKERAVDLIAMATAGNHGFLDGLRGSTTSQVVADAPCPVLALPAIALRGTKPKSSLEAGEAQQS